jgi:hypothetical protein
LGVINARRDGRRILVDGMTAARMRGAIDEPEVADQLNGSCGTAVDARFGRPRDRSRLLPG